MMISKSEIKNGVLMFNLFFHCPNSCYFPYELTIKWSISVLCVSKIYIIFNLNLILTNLPRLNKCLRLKQKMEKVV